MTVQSSSGPVWGRNFPSGLEQSVPRRVRIRQDVFYTAWLIVAGFVAVVAFVTLPSFVAAHRASLLLDHGVVIHGTVRSLTVGRARRPPTYRVDYDFTDPLPPNSGERVQSGRGFVTDQQFLRLSVGSVVDVVFLPLRPDTSMLLTSLARPSDNTWQSLGIGAAAIAVFPVIGGMIMGWLYWRDRRLLRWGRCTTATVTSVLTIPKQKMPNRGRFLMVKATFEFRDSTGKIRRVWISNVGRTTQKAVGASTRSFAAGDIATVLYDPTNPARADLYPLRVLALAPQ